MDTGRDIAAVVFVLALLGGVLWTLRRTGSFLPRRVSKRPRRLETMERVSLTPQHTLHLVRFGGQELVVSTHPHGCTVLLPNRDRQEAEI